VAQINAQIPTWRLTGFYDDGLRQGTQVDEFAVLEVWAT